MPSRSHDAIGVHTDVTGPHTLRMSKATRLACVIGACMLVALVAGGGGLSAIGVIHNPNPPASLVMMGTGVVAVAAFIVVAALRNQVTLYPDTIEVVRNLSPMRRLARSEIVGRRLVRGSRANYYYVLICRDGDVVKLPSLLEYNKAFHAWMADIPMLKA